MGKEQLRIGQVWANVLDSRIERTITHLATEGVGDSVAWQDNAGIEGGGSAVEFVSAHRLKTSPPNDTVI